jgi:hypothetical protein
LLCRSANDPMVRGTYRIDPGRNAITLPGEMLPKKYGHALHLVNLEGLNNTVYDAAGAR